jgi:hypothetical protein
VIELRFQKKRGIANHHEYIFTGNATHCVSRYAMARVRPSVTAMMGFLNSYNSRTPQHGKMWLKPLEGRKILLSTGENRLENSVGFKF